MKSSSKIIFGIVIILFAVSSLAIKFWAVRESLAIKGPTFMRVSPEGNLAIRVGTSLIALRPDGTTQDTISFAEVGLRLHGDFDYFSNGDLLIYHGNDPSGILQGIERGLVLKETRNDPPTKGTGLFRCNAKGQNCRRFSKALPAFHSVFRLVINRTDDTVYIADTTRFALYKLDKQGRLLAKQTEGLKFPNQILLKNNNLYIADTNHHRIKVVSTKTETFGEEIAQHLAVIDFRHRWPSQIVNVLNSWWVLIVENGMEHGRIQVFDSAWKAIDAPLLPTGSDSLGLVFFSDQIWITDMARFMVYRFSQAGERLADSNNPELNNLLSETLAKKTRYESLSTYGMIGFTLILIAGFVGAFILEKKESSPPPFKQTQYAGKPIGNTRK